MHFIDTHLAKCEEAATQMHDPDDVEGGRPTGSFCSGLPGVELAALPDGYLKRSDVFRLAQNGRVNTLSVCAAIMAWGGMQANHCRSFFETAERGWLAVADDIRCGMIEPDEAYQRLHTLKGAKKLKGAGPAFYTKLIYFLTPHHRTARWQAYIMDQWVGCSVNLLVGHEVVLMDISRTWKMKHGVPEPSWGFTVAAANTAANYREFCAALDALASHLGLDCDQLDRTLCSSSRGGRDPEPWRKYVIDHRGPCDARFAI